MARSLGLLIVALVSVALGATVTPRRICTASSTSSTPSSLVARVCALRGGATERTFAMLKPDVAKDSATVNGIKAMIDGAGLTIEREERCRLSRRQCETFYAEHAERSFFPDLVRFMSSDPVIKLELSGSDAVKRWRTLLGPTNSAVAREKAPKSVRALFGTDQQRNAAHGSVSKGRNRKS